MVMDPKNHPRGSPPDFTLPKPNPDPKRITDALWWLVCMRLALEPTSRNGGILAIKPGYHSYGSRLPDHGAGNAKTDHSIRWAYDREGPWWREYASAHDWTFQNAHGGNYTEISRYTSRLINAMKDPKDLRPDDVYAYTIGQADGDLKVEGYHERTNEEISGDNTHLWHRHDSFRRNIIGNKWAMWKALTIDMDWTYAEWLKSTEAPKPPAPRPEAEDVDLNDTLWDKTKPPEWTTPFQAMLAGANPTVRNVALHTMRHAAETGDAVDKLAATAAAQQAKLDQMAAVVGAQSAKLDAILAVLTPPPAEG